MDEEQYKILIQFPLDKSWLTGKEFEEILDGVIGRPIDYKEQLEVYYELFKVGWIEGGMPEPGLRITDKGIKEITKYQRPLMKLYRNKPLLFAIEIIVALATILATIIALRTC